MSTIILPDSISKGIDYNDFDQTNKIGKRGEARVRDYLVFRDLQINFVSEGYQPKYDIIYTSSKGLLTSMEIKTCLSNSYNIPYEYESRGKPSGIVSTKSECFSVYREHYDKLYVGKTQSIRDLIERYENQIRRVRNTKNNTNTMLYLMPERIFSFEGFRIIDLSNVPRIHDPESE